MKYLKIYEEFNNVQNYMVENSFSINEVIEYLGGITPEEVYNQSYRSVYDIDVIKFFKEIFLKKNITCTVTCTVFQKFQERYRYISGKVEKIDKFFYKEFYIKVKLYNIPDWYLIVNDHAIYIKNYDADSKPLHKEVVFKKEAEKYNL